MKNTVYSLARTSSADCMEEFGKELVAFLLESNPQVSAAQSLTLGKILAASPHKRKAASHDLCAIERRASNGGRRCDSQRGAHGSIRSRKSRHHENIGLGICRLPKNFFDHSAGNHGPVVRHFSSRALELFVPDLPFVALRSTVRDILLSVFASHSSKSVQHTLYAMGERVLANVSEITDIELTMPNRHYLLADLSRFGQDNPNEIFVPIDEPHGTIEARIRRQG